MITGLNHITLGVSDLQRSVAFYADLLGFERVAEWERGAYLEAGPLWLALLLDPKIKESKRPDYSHIAFSVMPDDFAKLKSRLEDAGNIAWQENTSEGESYYFNDPDGHKLEIHLGNLESRLSAMKEKPSPDIWFLR